MSAPWTRFYEQGVPATIDYPSWTLPDLLDHSADEYPDQAALTFFVDPKLPPSRMTYRGLRDATLRFATALYQLGVRKGDRVAIMLPNCPEFPIVFFGLLRLGAIAVNTNPLYVSRELKSQLNDSGAETIVLLDQLFPRLREIREQTRVKRVIVTDVAGSIRFPFRQLVHLVQRKHGEYVKVKPQSDIFMLKRLIAKHPPSPPQIEVAPGDVALFQYTGGTTGTPKAAMLSHHNLVANTLQLKAWFVKAEPGKETVMAAIPFFHVYGMTVAMIFGLYSGANVVMVPRPKPVDGVMKIIQKMKVSIFPGVPTLYTAINHHPDVKKYELGSVKLCLSGAAPLPMEVAETFEKITGGRLVEGYGMTECSPVATANPLFGKRKVGTIGLPMPDTDAKIADLETGRTLAPGQEGELAIKGPQVMLGYWNRPDETAQTIKDGWLHTGDVAKVDDEGYIQIVDRAKDMIAASGLKVLPREVEEVLFLHPKVQEAVVAGIPDPYRGETVKAYVVLKQGESATQDEIRDFCRLHLAPFKVPTQVEFRTDLPKSMIGKVLRRVLVEEEAKKLAGKTPQA
jgi:long-chain acyl-CoA synthetase